MPIVLPIERFPRSERPVCRGCGEAYQSETGLGIHEQWYLGAWSLVKTYYHRRLYLMRHASRNLLWITVILFVNAWSFRSTCKCKCEFQEQSQLPSQADSSTFVSTFGWRPLWTLGSIVLSRNVTQYRNATPVPRSHEVSKLKKEGVRRSREYNRRPTTEARGKYGLILYFEAGSTYLENLPAQRLPCLD